MYGRNVPVGVLLMFTAVSVALACGPFFPWQLLDNRTVTLRSTPHNSFAWEASHLVRPLYRLAVVEAKDGEDDSQTASDFKTAEDAGLSEAQIAQVDAMRGMAKDDDA